MKKYLLLFILCSFSTISIGQMKRSQAIDSLFIEWDKPDVPGCAIGIIKDGKLIYSKGYGIADLEHDIEITPSSVFYTGFISKQFVTISILLLEEQGKLNLDDKIQKHLPDFPTYDAPITIKHLIDHTSGVRGYGQLMSLRGRSLLDNIDEEESYELIKRQKELRFAPGKKNSYSNSDYTLLAMIVEKVAGQSLKYFANEHIFEPLGMTHTLFYDDLRDLVKNRAFSYYKKRGADGFDNNIRRYHMIGSGGLYTSIEDLYLWDLNLYNNKLGKGGQQIIKKLHEVGSISSGERMGEPSAYKFGIYKGLKTITIEGGWQGYNPTLLRFPDEKVTIIILANRRDFNTTNKSFQIADIILRGKLRPKEMNEETPIKKKDIIKLATSQLQEFCGYYWNENALYSRKIYLKNDTLIYSRGETNESKLIPYSNNEFRMEGFASDLVKFENSRQGVKSMIFIGNNGNLIKSTAYEPVSFNVNDYKIYEGFYYCEELDAWYKLFLDDGRLMVNTSNNVARELKPSTYSMDAFTTPGIGILHFYEQNEEIKGFELDARGVTNLNFEKK